MKQTYSCAAARQAAAWRRCAALVLGLGCASGCGDGAAPSGTFIALQSDFAPFQTWERVFVGDGPLEGHPAGERYGYIKQRTPAGATAYPVGAMLVKTIETGTAPDSWDVFAMVKRGGGYNQGGATDWEFFTLRINPMGVPIIVTRGTNPADAEVDGGVGHGYAASSDGVTCNRCHGAAGTERSDHILSVALAPGGP